MCWDPTATHFFTQVQLGQRVVLSSPTAETAASNLTLVNTCPGVSAAFCGVFWGMEKNEHLLL